MEERIEEVSISKEGISLKSVTLNTLLTLLTAVGVAVISVLLWGHQQDTRQNQDSLASVLKEQTAAIREQIAVQRENTCMLRFSQETRQVNAEFCKQVSGVTSR